MAKTPNPTAVSYGDQTITRGAGGETHQRAEDGFDVLTTQQGMPVSDEVACQGH